jgi:hypothetical protein
MLKCRFFDRLLRVGIPFAGSIFLGLVVCQTAVFSALFSPVLRAKTASQTDKAFILFMTDHVGCEFFE